jgi:hypothetical protein
MRRIRTIAAIGLTVAAFLAATPARAGGSVDPDDLVPSPPPGADCSLDGNWVLCHTAVAHEPVNEPILELPCGTVYETAIDARRGLRWYDASSNVIQRRFVFQDLEGTWSLSPTDDSGPVTITAHTVYRNIGPFDDPEDPESWPTTQHGVGITLQAMGFGVIFQTPVPDLDEPDHGIGGLVQTPVIANELCEALSA